MAVYLAKKGCRGCKTHSPYQADHNHGILDSVEYEQGKKWIFIIGFVLLIGFIILPWLFG